MGEFLFDPEFREAKIKILGIGGGGSNAVNYMVLQGLPATTTIAANTDKQALEHIQAQFKVQIGRELTQGLGAGGNPEIGYRAMEEARDEIRELLQDADMVFLTAGMGGGTGTGGIQVAADLCRELGILSVAVVTLPFEFEGPDRMETALEWLEKLEDRVDTLIVIPNQKLYELYSDITLVNAFAKSNEVLYNAVSGIVDIIVRVGLVNVDFADVRAIMKEGGRAIMGTGYGEGEDRAIQAARNAISSPLLDGVSISGAKGILVNFMADQSFGLGELAEASNYILQEAKSGGSKPRLIFGTVLNDALEGKVRVTVIATGIGTPATTPPKPAEYEPWENTHPSDADLFGDTAIRKKRRRSTFRRRLPE